jgi:Na+/melibiose symporter-like transporter
MLPMQLSTKLYYGVGQLSDGVKQASFSTFLFFYYNQVLGLSGSLAGLAALLALVVVPGKVPGTAIIPEGH